MLSPTATSKKIQAALTRYGSEATLRRRVGTTSTFIDVSLKAHRKDYRPEELVGALKQGDIRVIVGVAEIEAAGWPAPPRTGDLLVLSGKTWTVQGAVPTELSSVVVAYNLWCRGG